MNIRCQIFKCAEVLPEEPSQPDQPAKQIEDEQEILHQENIESSTKTCKHLTSSLGSFDSPMLRPRPSVSESVLTFAETDLTLLLEGGGGNIMHWAAYLQQMRKMTSVEMVSSSKCIGSWNFASD